MKQIQYSGASFQVSDLVADAVVAYAASLSSRGRTDSIVLPVLAADGEETTVTLLLNSATSLLVSGSSGSATGLDERAVAADLDRRREWLDALPAVAPDAEGGDDLLWIEFPEAAEQVGGLVADTRLLPRSRVAEAPPSLIFTVVYVSTLDHALGAGEIRALLEQSRAHNSAQGISGMLIFRGRRVMQLLEGAESDVRALYSRILADSRHEGVVTVWTSLHEQRRFPDWSMGFDELDLPADSPVSPTWPEPDLAALTRARPEEPADEYLHRRSEALRRALVSGDRLVASLAVILHGHRPESVLDGAGAVRRRCAECRPHASFDSYPCSTAKNAIWALEAE